MKKKIIGCFLVLVIATVAAFNLNLNNNENNMSSLTLANVEALADNENNGNGWTEEKTESTTYMNNKEHKKSVIVNCYKGGPNPSCSSSCKYQLKNDNGTWSSWINC